MSNRRNFLIPLFVAFMGLIAFYNVASGPRFAAIRWIDVIQLLAAGMCFGSQSISFSMASIFSVSDVRYCFDQRST